MPKKQWSCESVKREFRTVSETEFRERLAESFEVLLKEKSQQQNLPEFFKESESFKLLAPKLLPERKGA